MTCHEYEKDLFSINSTLVHTLNSSELEYTALLLHEAVHLVCKTNLCITP